jgi:leucyl-tRNA synthetase
MFKFVLPMFPFTSGNLHLGHFRVYVIADVINRYLEQPPVSMGFDSFGLPAESAALRNKTLPQLWTEANIAKMINQFSRFDVDYKFDSKVYTHLPVYYKHTQNLFIILYRLGLAFKRLDFVNWDPIENTVLANEQVVHSKSVQSGAVVERRLMSQWFFNTRAFAAHLLQDLDKLDWPENIKAEQRAWIGEMRGVNVKLSIHGSTFDCFVMNPDHLVKSTFVMVGPNSPILKFVTDWKNIDLFLKRKGNRLDSVYTGLQVCINNVKMPLLISNLMSNDDCFYGCVDSEKDHAIIFEKYVKNLDCMLGNENVDLKFNQIGSPFVNYKLKDWLISRQRYWGTPIPMVNCPDCGPIVQDNIPVLLPPCKHNIESAQTNCPQCGNSSAVSELDTMDGFVDSSFYYFRFLDSSNDSVIVSKEKARPVDIYIGGKEHAVLHLLYARFITKVLFKAGLIDFDEPFKQLLVQGVVKSIAYCDSDNRYHDKDSLTAEQREKYKRIEKMSKSKYNGVSPIDVIDRYGVDACRLFILYKAKVKDDIMWTEDGIKGMSRFLNQVEQLVKNLDSTELAKRIEETNLNSRFDIEKVSLIVY